MAVKSIQMYRRQLDGTETDLNPLTESQYVLMENGQTVQEVLSDRDSDKYTPVITNSSSTFKVGQGDNVDLSSSMKEGAYDSCVLKGKTKYIDNDTQEILDTFQEGRNLSLIDVKSPILSNVGKNLFDGELVQLSNKQFVRSVNYIHINSNETYAISFVSNTGVATFPTFIYYNEKKEEIGVYEGKTTENMPQDTKFIKFQLYSNVSNFTTDLVVNVQIEQGSSATSYEPYKSNILSVNGDKIELTEAMFEQGHCGYNSSVIGSTYDEFKGVTAPSFQAIRVRSKSLVKVKPNTSYFIKADSTKYNFGMQGFDNNKLSIGYDTNWQTDHVFTTPANMHYASLHIRKNNDGNLTPTNVDYSCIQLSEVDKTIVLRSLPNGVCDTLNVETGEYVQRIEEIVWDKTINASVNSPYSTENHLCFDIYNVPKGKIYEQSSATGIITNSLIPRTWLSFYGSKNDEEGIVLNRDSGTTLLIKIAKSKLTSLNLEGLRTYLSQNPITVQYELVTPIVTTIDMQGFPYAYTNGHIQLTSGSIKQSLTPKVEYSLSANKTGQINSNTKRVSAHQKQLDDFEAMMLTQMVQSAYDKAILQFDYEMQMMSLGGE